MDLMSLEPNKRVDVRLRNRDVLVANLEGAYSTIGNRCTHAGCALSEGTLTRESVKCSCHVSVFNVKTGNVVIGPAKTPEPAFQVRIEKDGITVNV